LSSRRPAAEAAAAAAVGWPGVLEVVWEAAWAPVDRRRTVETLPKTRSSSAAASYSDNTSVCVPILVSLRLRLHWFVCCGFFCTT